ncbi:precorrin-2 dehydrogenase/sirohydrochlorin ferrochelatase [Orenia metallireducens]|jgi:precorrin-2 dehydrogenase/sirohydrochlorin ferrochelatase|uniref:precorrin-2 dehydrogenase n=1 Tax=Orenia metallireducens TaxID=1413210 RepID=A0A285GSA8_9FIRM|nr:bifunctional precorrin-2 dehydrogenase/sirohydrochlorin ferrochelatase [Orenia metallireducens]PRX29867.1 precorrin-2 dehydrogenase/sirohydrochlorin ferrochelatase [Orenia metallireducens]SNY25396.1 precorrin-2 dehydrogenase / sirohydrochlorin ferrochelatase [Orenia metallireducens]
MSCYPINLKLSGKRVLIVGGGKVAYRKAKRLLEAKAEITLVSPTVIDELKYFVLANNIKYYQREFKKEDMLDTCITFAVTDNRRVNSLIASLADKHNLLVNVADSLEESTFTLPALIKQGDLLLTVATGGNLPALSKRIREELENSFGEEFKVFLELMKILRPIIIDNIDDEKQRRKIFRELADLELIRLLAEDKDEFLEKLNKSLPAKVRKICDLAYIAEDGFGL